MISSNLVGCCTGRGGRRFAPEDAVDITGRAPTWVDLVDPVAHQATLSDKLRARYSAGTRC